GGLIVRCNIYIATHQTRRSVNHAARLKPDSARPLWTRQGYAFINKQLNRRGDRPRRFSGSLMTSAPSSFIDIAVMEEVRGRFAAGDALAILTVDLEAVLWANGAGAALFGYPDIEAVMGASPGLTFAARRQISAAPGFPRIGRDRAVAVRVASGLTSRLVTFLASGVTLPDGEPAI